MKVTKRGNSWQYDLFLKINVIEKALSQPNVTLLKQVMNY